MVLSGLGTVSDICGLIKSTPDHPLTVVNTKVDGVDAYATNDLLEPHPTKSGLWQVHGRRDDQIILSNGEKVSTPMSYMLYTDLAAATTDKSVTSWYVYPLYTTERMST